MVITENQGPRQHPACDCGHSSPGSSKALGKSGSLEDLSKKTSLASTKLLEGDSLTFGETNKN